VNGTRARRIVACLAVIAIGLALRRFGPALGLPFGLVKYGGSILWGAMVFLLVAIVAARWTRARIALAALVVAVAVELFRLVHAPELDAFRLTTLGALLLGRVFSPWNIVAYAGGIVLGWAIDARWER
jgi:hypothetical protein